MEDQRALVPARVADLANNWQTRKDNPMQEQGYDRTPYTVMDLPVRRLFIDLSYQRVPVPTHVTKLMNNWQWDLVSMLEVNRRADNVFAVFDGGQRTTAVMKLFGPEQEVPCKVFDRLGIETEARYYVDLNKDRKPIKTIERAKGGIRANDPDWLSITQVLDQFQLAWSADTRVSGDRCINCWAALRGAYATGGSGGGAKHLRDTLQILTDVWKGDPASLEGNWISGMSSFIRSYSWCSHFDKDRVIERLSPYSIGDVVNAHQKYRVAGLPVKVMYRKAFQEFYNKGLRSGKLLTKAEAED